MPLSEEEVEQLAKEVASEITVHILLVEEQIEMGNILVGELIGAGAIPVHGRENRKEPCEACRIDPNGPLEAGNVMATTKDAIGTLSESEVRDWCSTIVERKNGRCERAMSIRKAAEECKAAHPTDTQAYFECFVPHFRGAVR